MFCVSERNSLVSLELSLPTWLKMWEIKFSYFAGLCLFSTHTEKLNFDSIFLCTPSELETYWNNFFSEKREVWAENIFLLTYIRWHRHFIRWNKHLGIFPLYARGAKLTRACLRNQVLVFAFSIWISNQQSLISLINQWNVAVLSTKRKYFT